MFNVWLPKTFNIGPLTVTFYALFILIGILIAVWMGIREGKKLGVSSEFIYTGVVLIVPLSIIGARLWYVLFNPVNSFMELIGFDANGNFEGLSGLAIHGGLMVAIVAVYIYCKKKDVSIYKVIDFVAPGFFVGQILGRFGNFFNHELYGPIVENFEFLANIPILGENMYIGGAYRHPVFLYESLGNLAGLILLLVLRRKSKKLLSGDLMAIYLLWYGVVRIFTETLRLNSGVGEAMTSGKLSVSLMISILFIVAGVGFFIIKRKFGPKKYYQEIIESVNNNRIDTILFDLDGTLLNTKELIDKSFVHTFSHFRPDMTITDEMLDSFFGPTLRQTFSRFSDDEDEINEMISYYREFNIANHDNLVKKFSGVKETVKTLYNKGYNLGVVSSKKTDLVKRGLECAGIIEYMDVIVGENEVTNHKPAPDGILYALDKLKEVKNEEQPQEEKSFFLKLYEKLTIKPKKAVNRAIYIGDTINDMKAAKAAGIKSVGVLYIKNPAIMLEANPDYVINKMSELLSICVE